MRALDPEVIGRLHEPLPHERHRDRQRHDEDVGGDQALLEHPRRDRDRSIHRFDDRWSNFHRGTTARHAARSLQIPPVLRRSLIRHLPSCNAAADLSSVASTVARSCGLAVDGLAVSSGARPGRSSGGRQRHRVQGGSSVAISPRYVWDNGSVRRPRPLVPAPRRRGRHAGPAGRPTGRHQPRADGHRRAGAAGVDHRHPRARRRRRTGCSRSGRGRSSTSAARWSPPSWCGSAPTATSGRTR